MTIPFFPFPLPLPLTGLTSTDCHIVAATAEALTGRHRALSAGELQRVTSCLISTNGAGTRIALARAFVSRRPAPRPDPLLRLLRALDPTDRGRPRAFDRGLAVLLAFVALYIGGGIALALTVDRGFVFTDAIAAVVFAILIGGLLVLERRGSGSQVQA